MTDEELKKLVASLAVAQKETSEQMKKGNERMDKLEKFGERLGKMVGGISNNQGDVAEEFFFNSLAAKPEVANITYDFVDKNITRTRGQLQDEFDLVMVNGTDVLVIETKYKAHENDLDRLLNKKFPNFKQLYPQYKNYRHHLGLASFHINENLKEQALTKNVIVLQRKGKVIETSIPKER